MTSLDGVELVPGRYSATFTSSSVKAKVDCNTATGGYTIAGDQVTPGRMALSQVGCNGDSQVDKKIVETLIRPYRIC